jgi:hypothetical protein
MFEEQKKRDKMFRDDKHVDADEQLRMCSVEKKGERVKFRLESHCRREFEENASFNCSFSKKANCLLN